MPDRGEEARLSIPEKMNLAEFIVDEGARKFGESEALICTGSRELGIPEERVSFEDLSSLTSRLADEFKSSGMNADDRVLLVLPDSTEFYLAFYGAMKLGAVPVPVNTYLTSKDYEYYLTDSRARYAVIFSEFHEAVRACKKSPFLREVFSEDDLRKMAKKGDENFKPLRLSRDAMAFWLYSSGTTGLPKGVVHLQHDPVVVCENIIKRVYGINQRDICYSVSKLFFSYGLSSCGFGSLYSGATTILNPDRPDVARTIEILEKYKPTVLFTVPSFYARLVSEKPPENHNLRLAVSGGEPLPESIWHRFKEVYGTEIVEHIGSTEALYAFIGHYPGKVKPGYTGVVLPGWEVKLVDDGGNEITGNGIGKLLVRGDSIAAFYWEKHEKTKKTFIGEWYDTGDTFVREGRYYRHYGRADDLIKTRGLWVSPVKVENALMKYPYITDCAVVQGFNEKGLEVVACYLIMNRNHGNEVIDDIKKFLREQGLKGFEIPEKWVFVEDLPRTATGKIQRYRLRMIELERVRK